MRVTVTPEATAGTNKGGEDLHLVVRARVDGNTPPTSLEGAEVTVEQSGTCLLDADDQDEEENSPLFCWKVRTNHDEFEWEGTTKDVLGLESRWEAGVTVKDRLLDVNNWKYGHRPGQDPFLVFEHRHFVNGNAD